jgi:hypothetical protein
MKKKGDSDPFTFSPLPFFKRRGYRNVMQNIAKNGRKLIAIPAGQG